MRAYLIASLSLFACAERELSTPEPCDDPLGGTAAEITQRREQFNAALASGDIDGVADVLDRDTVLISGTDSDMIAGRDAQVAIWRADFASGPGRTIYERTPICIRASAVLPLASETGTWRGWRGESDYASGTYSAKWRRDEDGSYRVEAEIDTTEGCGGALCPQR